MLITKLDTNIIPLASFKLLNGQELSFDAPLVMGVINITPDSFFDGGKHRSQAPWT